MDWTARRETWATWDPWDLRESPVMFLRRDRRVSLDHLDSEETMDATDLMVCLERRDRLVFLDLDALERRETAEMSDPQDWMDSTELLEIRETVVSLDSEDSRETRDPLEPLEFPETLDSTDSRETRACPDPLACAERRVTLVSVV